LQAESQDNVFQQRVKVLFSSRESNKRVPAESKVNVCHEKVKAMMAGYLKISLANKIQKWSDIKTKIFPFFCNITQQIIYSNQALQIFSLCPGFKFFVRLVIFSGTILLLIEILPQQRGKILMEQQLYSQYFIDYAFVRDLRVQILLVFGWVGSS